MSKRIVAVWAVALVACAGIAAVAFRPTTHRPPALSSGPLFAARPGLKPFTATKHAVPVTVRLTDHGCVTTPSKIVPGPVTFTVVNPGHTRVNEAELSSPAQGSRILGEYEGADPGTSGSFSLVLDEGTYALNCPGTGAPAQPFQVVAARG